MGEEKYGWLGWAFVLACVCAVAIHMVIYT